MLATAQSESPDLTIYDEVEELLAELVVELLELDVEEEPVELVEEPVFEVLEPVSYFVRPYRLIMFKSFVA